MEQLALMLASKYSSTESSEEIVNFLLENGANVNIQNNMGTSALKFSAASSRKESSEKTVKMLLEHGANVNSQGIDGITTLMFCIYHLKTTSTLKTINLLLEYNADINLGHERGNAATMALSRYPSDVTNIILPKREMYVKNIPLNTSIIIKRNIKCNKIDNVDFKIFFDWKIDKFC